MVISLCAKGLTTGERDTTALFPSVRRIRGPADVS